MEVHQSSGEIRVDLFMSVELHKVRYVWICLCQWNYTRLDTCGLVYVSGITEVCVCC